MTLQTHPLPSADRSLRAGALTGLLPIALGAAIVIGWALLMRLPWWHVSGPDDAFYSEVALLWRQGTLPYASVFDVKPPGFFAILALMQSITGVGLTALRLTGALADALTMGLLLQFGIRRGAPWVGVGAALVFALYSRIALVEDCYSVLIALTTLAMMLGLSSLRLDVRALLAGLTLGAAVMVKQTTVFEGLALSVILLGDPSSVGRRGSTGALFVGTAALIPLVTLGYFAWHGAADAFLNDVVGLALQRPGAKSDSISFVGGFFKFAFMAQGLAPLLLTAATTVMLQARARRWRREIDRLGFWFMAAFAGVLIQHALLPTYLGPLMPPTLLLAGLGLTLRFGAPRRLAAIGLTGLALMEATLAAGATWQTNGDDISGLTRAAAVIRAAGPSPDDRLYVIDTAPTGVWLYAATGLKPATPYLIPSQMMCDFPGVGIGRIAEAFSSRPRFVVTDDLRPAYRCTVEGAKQVVTSGVAAYRHLQRVIGDDGAGYDVYERRDR